MRRVYWGSMVAAYACAILGFTTFSASSAASHAAAYLDDLQLAVAGTLETEGDTLTIPQRKALTAATKALNKTSKTFSADLALLARAAKSINPTSAIQGGMMA